MNKFMLIFFFFLILPTTIYAKQLKQLKKKKHVKELRIKQKRKQLRKPKKIKHFDTIELEKEDRQNQRLCGPDTVKTLLTVSGTVFVATLQVIATILTLVLH